MEIKDIRVGAFYSNGDFGNRWMVRQVLAIDLDLCEKIDDEVSCVHYKVLVGKGRRKSYVVPEVEFASWARYEVARNENSWERVDSNDSS